MESSTHKRLKVAALGFLKRKCRDIVANEVKFRRMKSIADAVGINISKKEVRVIEVKATLADYKRDKKLFNKETSYFGHCTYFYIACPPGIIKKEDIIPGTGLLYIDEHNNVEVIQNPTKNDKLHTRYDTTLKNTVRVLTNCLLFKYHNIAEEVPGFDKYSKKRRRRRRKK